MTATEELAKNVARLTVAYGGITDGVRLLLRSGSMGDRESGGGEAGQERCRQIYGVEGQLAPRHAVLAGCLAQSRADLTRMMALIRPQ